MKLKTISTVIVLLTSSGISLNTWAAEKEKVVDIGQREYMNKCVLCHGQSGKGDGSAIDFLKVTPTDLTILSKQNGGVFPVDRVISIIDGREFVKGHGTRDMPIWGKDYSLEKSEAAEYYFDAPYNTEMYVRARILALIDYLNRIQVK